MQENFSCRETASSIEVTFYRLQDESELLRHRSAELQETIDRPALRIVTEQELLKRERAPFVNAIDAALLAVDRAEEDLHIFKSQKKLRDLVSPKKWRAQEQLEAKLDEAERELESRREELANLDVDLRSASKTKDREMHALQTAARARRREKHKLDALDEQREIDAEIAQIERCTNQLNELYWHVLDASSPTDNIQKSISRALAMEKIPYGKFLHWLQLQRRPLAQADRMEAWIAAVKLMQEARKVEFGYFVPSRNPKFHRVAQRVLQLVQDSSAVNVKIPRHSDLDRSWLDMCEGLTNPKAFVPDCLWIVYWFAFGVAQQFAELATKRASEDLHSGTLTGIMMSLNGAFNREWFRNFGFQHQVMDIMVLRLASTKAETALKGDLGLMCDLQFEEYSCRKIAILQSKVSRGDEVSLDAKQYHQLDTLAAKPGIGYYAFYQSDQSDPSCASVTIRSATDIHNELTDFGRYSYYEGDIPSWTVSTVSDALDFPSFLALGLGDPNSGIGASYFDLEDGISKLSEGDDGLRLPDYVCIYSAGSKINEIALERLRSLGYVPELELQEKQRLQEQERQQRPSPPELELGF